MLPLPVASVATLWSPLSRTRTCVRSAHTSTPSDQLVVSALPGSTRPQQPADHPCALARPPHHALTQPLVRPNLSPSKIWNPNATTQQLAPPCAAPTSSPFAITSTGLSPTRMLAGGLNASAISIHPSPSPSTTMDGFTRDPRSSCGSADTREGSHVHATFTCVLRRPCAASCGSRAAGRSCAVCMCARADRHSRHAPEWRPLWGTSSHASMPATRSHTQPPPVAPSSFGSAPAACWPPASRPGPAQSAVWHS